MRGISEERLIEVLDAHGISKRQWLRHDLINECTELTPWWPIESAPKDRRILLFFPETEEYCKHTEVGFIPEWSANLATHWQELPDDPK